MAEADLLTWLGEVSAEQVYRREKAIYVWGLLQAIFAAQLDDFRSHADMYAKAQRLPAAVVSMCGIHVKAGLPVAYDALYW